MQHIAGVDSKKEEKLICSQYRTELIYVFRPVYAALHSCCVPSLRDSFNDVINSDQTHYMVCVHRFL